jgi:hypothetical protein
MRELGKKLPIVIAKSTPVLLSERRICNCVRPRSAKTGSQALAVGTSRPPSDLLVGKFVVSSEGEAYDAHVRSLNQKCQVAPLLSLGGAARLSRPGNGASFKRRPAAAAWLWRVGDLEFVRRGLEAFREE